jgi:hypothetical protein
MIVVVGQYPTIPLEMFTRIVYGPPTDSPECGITWKMCSREVGPRFTLQYRCKWLPYVAYPRAHVCRVGQVYTPVGFVIDLDLRNVSDSLLTAPTHRYACFIL